MASFMDEATVRHVAMLARLHVDDAEVTQYAAQLSRILDYVALLNRLDTEKVAPTAHATAAANVLRDDKAGVPWDCERALANAPYSQSGFFRVPKVLDQD